jgi:deoxyribodipyrimidine photo-lyase
MPAYLTVIHWFRRDLRLTDNTALHHASSDAGCVVPVYVLSQWKEQHRWTGPARQSFLVGCLDSLAANIQAAGGRLIFREGDPVAVLGQLIRETGAEAVYVNRDPDPHGMKAEERLADACRELGVALHTFKDVVLHERDEVLTGAGGPFRVFTPYRRAWQKLPKPGVLPAVKGFGDPAKLVSLPCPDLAWWGLSAPPAGILPAGERAARDRMRHTMDKVLPHYGERRDIPDGQTTSRLSQDLRFGTLSIRELHARATALQQSAPAAVAGSIDSWINELAWREFYMQILWRFPEVLSEEFDPKFRGLPWEYDESRLERWKTGTTGFPIVDAGMRELASTGFMHNRVRMITAMFLTKDLRLDWRLGEQYFMQALTDGEIASNNGGWQWSAGTGADAAPYFRIQNPWTQAKRFDPEARYIRRWVPELAKAPAEALFAPQVTGIPGGAAYPRPMLDHSRERDRTLAMFKRHREQTAGA